MSLTFKLKMVFSVLCFFFICCCINTEASISIHISARSTALLKAMFHVPLLYFEHLPLQRSLHGPGSQIEMLTFYVVEIYFFVCFFITDGTPPVLFMLVVCRSPSKHSL